MFYKIAQLILKPGQNNNSVSDVYIAQPDSDKEHLAGKLFILIEIEEKNANNLKFVNFLISEINKNYYQNEKLILRERVSSIKIEHIFESALSKTNKSLAEYFHAPTNTLNHKLINATIGIIFENQLHFSLIGKNKAFLIYKNKPKNNSAQSEYRITDIIDRTDDGAEKFINTNKLFSNIVNGSIPEGGYFIFSNEALPEYISEKQLVEITTSLPPVGTVEQMKNLLSNVNTYISFLGIVIKSTLGQNISAEPERIYQRSTQASINNLKTTEEKTEKLLTPTGLIDFRQWLNRLAGLFSLSFSRPGALPGSGKILLTDKLSFRKRSNLKFLKDIYNSFKNGLFILLRFVAYLPNLARKDNLRTVIHSGKNINKIAFKPIGWFKALSKKQKILISAAIILIFIFVQNLLVLNYKNKKQTQQQAYGQIVTQIEDKENQVDSRLVYNNFEGARKLLAEIKALLIQLPAGDQQYANLFSKYDQQAKKINHEIKAEPQELANFGQLNQQAKPSNLTLINNKIYSGDSLNKTIYILDLKNNLVTALNNSTTAITELNFPAVDQNNIYYFNGENVLTIDSGNDELKSLSLNLNDKQGLASMALYNNKLYILNNQQNQIFRLGKKAGSFGSQISWLNKADPDLSNATSMAIDSSIYVLKADGKVLKFLRGAPQPFDLTAVDPTNQAVKLVVTAKNIYVLDAANKKLIAYDKNGKLTAQYQSDKFTNLKDVVIDETTKKAYLLADSAVLEINLQ